MPPSNASPGSARSSKPAQGSRSGLPVESEGLSSDAAACADRTAEPEGPAEIHAEDAADAVDCSELSSETEAAAGGALRLDPELLAELPAFEQFFKTFGFKRMHGRVWGLLVLSEAPLSSKEICEQLEISQGAASTTLSELLEWGAVTRHFDSSRRCHVHGPVGNALSIAATILHRREQVAFQQFRLTAERARSFIAKRYGERDPRVLTLRSIIAACEIADALMKLLVGTVANALGDSQSLLSRAIHAALRVGLPAPADSPTGFLAQAVERSHQAAIEHALDPHAALRERSGLTLDGSDESDDSPARSAAS
jgi:DNA-binding transcriptional ArsR family regulator